MHNPLRGVVSSEHEKDGGYKHHWGRDIAPRDANGKRISGAPVYAAFGGWIVTLVRWSKPGGRSWTWASYATGNGTLIRNPDGEAQGYNHVKLLSKYKVGSWVNEGDLLGYLDNSGNQTGQHLHFETWANWRNRFSHYSPKILFDKYKVNTNTDPGFVLASTPTTTTTSTEKESWLEMVSKKEFDTALDELEDRIYDRMLRGLKWADMGDDKLFRVLRDIREDLKDIKVAAQSSAGVKAWVFNPETKVQDTTTLAYAIQSIDAKLNALIEDTDVPETVLKNNIPKSNMKD